MLQEKIMEKVAIFITRKKDSRIDMLLLRHPYAGIQVPAGTVEEDETIHDAAVREAYEETGLKNLILKSYIGGVYEELPEHISIISQKTNVYARPDESSFDWAEFPRGTWVKEVRKKDRFTQVRYEEGNIYPGKEYITYCIMGWVSNRFLCRIQRRHFFHFTGECMKETWTTVSDNHQFELFWSPLYSLPKIVEPQNLWIEYVRNEL
jgi:8-oxo-dGTP pyrophosphatase MutT (NUDIX family)